VEHVALHSDVVNKTADIIAGVRSRDFLIYFSIC
jgi:hypothetical protein